MDISERVQAKAKKVVKEKKLRELTLESLEKRRLRGNLINVYKYEGKMQRGWGQTLFSGIQR